ncbi:LysR family transcriptional regulator [Siccirubricoccus phaeus]|uniref:LysR family transcriptional regulator n=1 Tax=Siccirubricoccus phaeus TaxID=2595053 RepID=UPI0011F290C3|nr:LysR family transcriptional regulator [Siccirubricoccus phaeus]
MDRLDAMRLFTRIVERRSFTLAAQDLGLPRSTATTVLRQMEERLGVRLLQRTTRSVRPTLDGEAWYRRCLGILQDLEEAEGALSGAEPRGLLRIDVQGTLARHFLLPGLPAFLARYPGIELAMSEGERWIDPVQEGVDCVLRFGQPPDSELVARRLGLLHRLTCAAPAYLAEFGVPKTPAALAAGHRIIGLRSLTTGALRPTSFLVAGVERQVAVPARVSVTGTESYLAALHLGLGLAQVPWFHAAADLAAGRLVEVLAETPPPPAQVSLLYPRSRQLSPRLRVFLDWAAREFAARNPKPPRAGAASGPAESPGAPDDATR